jgi:hypothetical protein
MEMGSFWIEMLTAAPRVRHTHIVNASSRPTTTTKPSHTQWQMALALVCTPALLHSVLDTNCNTTTSSSAAERLFESDHHRLCHAEHAGSINFKTVPPTHPPDAIFRVLDEQIRSGIRTRESKRVSKTWPSSIFLCSSELARQSPFQKDKESGTGRGGVAGTSQTTAADAKYQGRQVDRRNANNKTRINSPASSHQG